MGFTTLQPLKIHEAAESVGGMVKAAVIACVSDQSSWDPSKALISCCSYHKTEVTQNTFPCL